MMISCRRLTSLFKPLGFASRGAGITAGACGFVRPDDLPNIYQQVDLGFAGRRKDAVDADVSASVTKWIEIKGLTESRPLEDVAADKERLWTVIHTSDEARAWERLLVETAPRKVAEFAKGIGPSLLERTEVARGQAQSDLSRLNPSLGVSAQIAQFQESIPQQLLVEARRLADWPGVVQLYDTHDEYFLACLAIVSVEDELPHARPDPLVDEPFMWRIQLVADRILSWNRA